MLRPTSSRIPIAIAAMLALTLIPAVLKAVYVSPHAVFLDHNNRTGQVTVGNNSESAEEVTIDLRFGFPDTDSAGKPFIRFVDDPGPNFPSAADWIRPFPRRVRLEPGDQQTVRLLATPPDNLPDGEYWTRMIVTGRGATLPIVSSDTMISAGVTLEVRLITSIAFRKGNVRTGVTIREYSASVEGDSLIVWVDATREGNAAYLGTAEFDLLDQDREPVSQWATNIGIFYPMNRRFSFPIQSVPNGTYLLRLAFKTEREDLHEGDVLPAATVVDSLEITVS